jgi:hypothetical protein
MYDIILTPRQAQHISKNLLSGLLDRKFRVFVVLRKNDAIPSHFNVPGVVACDPEAMWTHLTGRKHQITKNVDLYNEIFSLPEVKASANYVRNMAYENLVKLRPSLPPFLSEIQEIFAGGKIKNYCIEDGNLNFQVHNFDITFEHLAQLSDLLKTRKIDFSEKTEYGGCDTCGHGMVSFTPIFCKNVSFPSGA